MRLTPQPPDIPEGSGFSDDNDLFSYRQFADRLTNLVRNIDDPMVAVLDGEWGSGKSTFVQQWAGSIRASGASVILFDAFSNDYYDDAFLALSSEIYALAEETLGADREASSRFFDKAKRAGSVLAPAALKIVARTATAGILSLDDIKDSSEAVKAAANTIGDESSKLVEEVISKRLRQAREEKVALQGFRSTLSQLSKDISEKKKSIRFPLIFIIDEIDRCNPEFAVSLIEKIKHLFSVSGVFFLLVTNLQYMEKIIRGSYGDSFDARNYMEKFYQFRISLPEKVDPIVEKHSKYISYLWRELDIRFSDNSSAKIVRKELGELADAHNLSLRQIERVMSHIVLLCAATKYGGLVIPTLVAGLCVMRHTNTELYQRVISNRANWNDIETFIKSNRKTSIDERSLKWWKYSAGGPMLQSEVDKLTNELVRFGIENGRQVLPILASYIDSLDVE